MSRLSPLPLFRQLSIALAVLIPGLATSGVVFSLVQPVALLAQSSSSSSSSTPESPAPSSGPTQPRVAVADTDGSAITLETSEPLFYLAVALNACGYNEGLAESSPVRMEIREEVNQQLAASASARDARDAVCTFIREHALADPARNLAQYVSLALYVTPPPELTTSVGMTDLPPDSTQVVEILPLVRTFADVIHLNAIFAEHRSEYDAFITRIHDPLTKMVVDTNIYLHMPMSSYDGRRFMVLIEPMLAPNDTNARIYGGDYIVVVSPAAKPPASVPMDLIRHTYLHYMIEPLVYSRASDMDEFLPLLKPVQDAPLDYTYKSDVVALLNECLIKAVEAQTMDVGIPRPVRPDVVKQRSDLEHYDAEMAVYDRQAEAVRRQTVARDMSQGWVLVGYFYDQLGAMQKESISLADAIGPMVYGMDVDRELHRDEQIVFVPGGSGGDIIRRIPHKLTSLQLAEMKLMKGDVAGSEGIAEATLKTSPEDAEAHYLLGRIDLMQGDADEALDQLTQTVKLSQDPRTIAWAHIFLGRLYDIEQPPEREKAIAEYRAALAHRDGQPDTKAAAELGIKEPFTLPKRTATSSNQQEEASPETQELDPSGKAEKEAYRPTPPQ